MKKILLICLSSLLSLSLISCGTDGVKNSSSQGSVEDSSSKSSSVASSSQDVGKTSGSQTESLMSSKTEDILVDYTMDSMTNNATVTITNNSDMVFDGTIHIKFRNSSGTLVGNDSIFVEELSVGSDTWVKIDVDETSNVQMEYEINNAEFTEGANLSESEVNTEKTNVLNESFTGSFGGAGNPEYATSWYPDVIEIVIIENSESTYAKFTVKNTSSKDNIDSIGNALFGNYKIGDKENIYELDSVVGYTEDKEEVFRREG